MTTGAKAPSRDPVELWLRPANLPIAPDSASSFPCPSSELSMPTPVSINDFSLPPPSAPVMLSSRLGSWLRTRPVSWSAPRDVCAAPTRLARIAGTAAPIALFTRSGLSPIRAPIRESTSLEPSICSSRSIRFRIIVPSV